MRSLPEPSEEAVGSQEIEVDVALELSQTAFQAGNWDSSAVGQSSPNPQIFIFEALRTTSEMP